MGLFNGLGNVGWAGFGALLVAVCATGCGGGDDKPSGGSADFGALQKQYSSPTGTLHAEDKSALLKALDNQSAASGLGGLSAMPGTPGGQKTLGASPITCGMATSSGVVCTCSGGGNLTETFSASQGSMNISGSAKYNACTLTEGTSTIKISGTLNFSDITTPPPALFIYNGTITETITPPGETVTVSINYAMTADGKTEYTVDVSDGNVVIAASGNWDSTTDSGTFTVTTKDGTSTCTLTNGAGSCTGPGGTVTFS